MKTKLTFFENNRKVKEVFNYFETKKELEKDFKETKKRLYRSEDWEVTEILENFISAKYKNKTTSIKLIAIKE